MTLHNPTAPAVDWINIQVAGFRNFPEYEWRNAILHFVFGLFRDDQYITGRPKITFGGLGDAVTLRLDPDEDAYYAYGAHLAHPLPRPLPDQDDILRVGPARRDVEWGLLRFAKSNKLRMLVILFKDGGGTLALWKGRSRGELFFTAWGIPKTCGGLGAS